MGVRVKSSSLVQDVAVAGNVVTHGIRSISDWGYPTTRDKGSESTGTVIGFLFSKVGYGFTL